MSADAPPITLRIAVKPRSRASELTPLDDGTWRARLKAPPVDGKANAELIQLVARHFGVPKSMVTIAAGTAGRTKRVVIGK